MLFFNKKGIKTIQSLRKTNTHCQAVISACFSPSVHSAFRKAWGGYMRFFYHAVKNGGTLTNTEPDFYNAHFFFCDGLEDPWLSE
ncbi:hypothetical protein M378DRAFT_157257 [Amanita muscaria Koide BX008]|uniref:Uncharacterized protein n=1 Tax=Amanita muscaria (strain Koide BX008) TaxID=946122 RepID=A0A0C2SZS5_AMAMK|nr:hypothetical protein M378DRAFT_157257 [Amanita muscaria Koide BX008]